MSLKPRKKTSFATKGNFGLFLLKNIWVDGKFGPWQDWSTCSQRCGGVQERVRVCQKPKNNGKPCTGERYQKRACSTGSACQGKIPRGFYVHMSRWVGQKKVTDFYAWNSLIYLCIKIKKCKIMKFTEVEQINMGTRTEMETKNNQPRHRNRSKPAG